MSILEKRMKSLVFHSPGKVSVDNVADPRLELNDDILLKVTAPKDSRAWHGEKK